MRCLTYKRNFISCFKERTKLLVYSHFRERDFSNYPAEESREAILYFFHFQNGSKHSCVSILQSRTKQRETPMIFFKRDKVMVSLMIMQLHKVFLPPWFIIISFHFTYRVKLGVVYIGAEILIS